MKQFRLPENIKRGPWYVMKLTKKPQFKIKRLVGRKLPIKQGEWFCIHNRIDGLNKALAFVGNWAWLDYNGEFSVKIEVDSI